MNSDLVFDLHWIDSLSISFSVSWPNAHTHITSHHIPHSAYRHVLYWGPHSTYTSVSVSISVSMLRFRARARAVYIYYVQFHGAMGYLPCCCYGWLIWWECMHIKYVLETSENTRWKSGFTSPRYRKNTVWNWLAHTNTNAQSHTHSQYTPTLVKSKEWVRQRMS